MRAFAERRLRRSAATCHWCSHPLDHAWEAAAPRWNASGATLDHLEPRSRGGTDRRSNLVVACASCNTVRGSVDKTLWAAWLTDSTAGRTFRATPPPARAAWEAKRDLVRAEATMLLVFFAVGAAPIPAFRFLRAAADGSTPTRSPLRATLRERVPAFLDWRQT